MSRLTRRTFVTEAAAVMTGGYVASRSRMVQAFPLPLPIGIQSWDLTPKLRADLHGTLRALAENGYQWIDWLAASRTTVPALASTPARDVHALFASYGLATHNISVTFGDLHQEYDKTIQVVRDFEATSVVCTPGQGQTLTLDHWKAYRDALNVIGEKTRRDGVLTGYHPQPRDFVDIDGVTPFDIILETDPALVKLQIDVGACAVSGKDPAAYLANHPAHYFSMHAKDVKDGRLGVAVGEGSLDWVRLFAAARSAKMRHYVVETGATEAEVLAKTKQSIDFLRAMPG